MPGVGMGGSVMANLVAQRAKLAAVRTRIGLEGAQAGVPQSNMRPAGPAANTPAPKAVVGPQAQAVMGPQPQGQAAPGGMALRYPQEGDQATVQAPAPGQPFAHTPAPEAKQQMLSMVQNFLTQHGPQQQALMDQQRQQTQAPPQGGGTAATGAASRLSPIANFHKEMGRLPTPQELVVLGAHTRLQTTLGRAPTRGELITAIQTPQAAAPAPDEGTTSPAPQAGVQLLATGGDMVAGGVSGPVTLVNAAGTTIGIAGEDPTKPPETIKVTPGGPSSGLPGTVGGPPLAGSNDNGSSAVAQPTPARASTFLDRLLSMPNAQAAGSNLGQPLNQSFSALSALLAQMGRGPQAAPQNVGEGTSSGAPTATGEPVVTPGGGGTGALPIATKPIGVGGTGSMRPEPVPGVAVAPAPVVNTTALANNFYQAAGRLPTPQEMMVLVTHAHLKNQWGRDPTTAELAAVLSRLQQATSTPTNVLRFNEGGELSVVPEWQAAYLSALNKQQQATGGPQYTAGPGWTAPTTQAAAQPASYPASTPAATAVQAAPATTAASGMPDWQKAYQDALNKQQQATGGQQYSAGPGWTAPAAQASKYPSYPAPAPAVAAPTTQAAPAAPAPRPKITPPDVGTGGLASAGTRQGPDGRTLADIKASGDYASDLERAWVLDQLVGQGVAIGADARAFLNQNQAALDTFYGSSASAPGAPSAPSGQPPAASPAPAAPTGAPTGAPITVPDSRGGQRTLSAATVAAIQAAFPPQEWQTAYRIAAAESGGISGGPDSATGDAGLFQINLAAHAARIRAMGFTVDQVRNDPVVNALVAADIWRANKGWGRQTGNPWSTAPMVFAAMAAR